MGMVATVKTDHKGKFIITILLQDTEKNHAEVLALGMSDTAYECCKSIGSDPEELMRKIAEQINREDTADKEVYNTLLDQITDLMVDIEQDRRFKCHIQDYMHTVQEMLKHGRITWYQRDKLEKMLSIAQDKING